MSIIYSITILALYIVLVLIQKTEKKQNIIMWLTISTILIFCYNILVCVLFTFIGILCTLSNLSICNMVVTAVLLSSILKTKKIQKYYFKISDLIFSVTTFIIVILIAYNQYGFEFNIKYYITDGSSHYFFAQQFYKNSTLLYKETTDDVLRLYNSDFRLPGAYVNEGILFKVFDKLLLKTDIFILFDLIILYLSGILFYYLLNTYSNGNKKLYILSVLLSMGYMLGYQLNSMLNGFIYLSLALDIIITLLLLLKLRKKEEITDTLALPILSLISFGIFFSYAYFIPIIYISVLINIIIISIRNKRKIFCISNIIEIAYLIVIPAILGIFYFIVLPLLNGVKTEISTIGVEGEIYKNYITNFLVLIPLYIIGTITFRKSKEKVEEEQFPTSLFIMSIIFTTILFIGHKLNIVSEYYFFKAYYIIWILAIYNAYICVVYIERNLKKTNNVIYGGVVGIILSIMIFTLIIPKSIGINHIFYKNQQMIRKSDYIIKKGEIEIANKLENLSIPKDVYVFTKEMPEGRMRWMSVLNNNQFIIIDSWYPASEEDITIEKWLSEKEHKYYLAYYEEYSKIENNKETLDENNDKYKIIHKDEYGFVLERR